MMQTLGHIANLILHSVAQHGSLDDWNIAPITALASKKKRNCDSENPWPMGTYTDSLNGGDATFKEYTGQQCDDFAAARWQHRWSLKGLQKVHWLVWMTILALLSWIVFDLCALIWIVI